MFQVIVYLEVKAGILFYLFIYSFGCAAQFTGSQFPNQGLNPGHGSKNTES